MIVNNACVWWFMYDGLMIEQESYINVLKILVHRLVGWFNDHEKMELLWYDKYTYKSEYKHVK